MSENLLWVPPITSTLRTGLIVYPTHWEGAEAESAAATEDAVSEEKQHCLPACLGFQGILPGGGRSVQFFLCVSAAHVAQENG